MDPSNPTVSQTPQQPVHTPEHHWMIPLVIISSFLIIGVGFGGYYLGTQQQRQPLEQAPISPTIVQEQGCTSEAKLCPDGSAVGRSGPNCEFTACPEVKTTPSQPSGECIRAGCNGEVCIEDTPNASNDRLARICMYKEEYKCMKNSRCEKQSDGKCGWTQTEEYNQCMNSVTESSTTPLE